MRHYQREQKSKRIVNSNKAYVQATMRTTTSILLRKASPPSPLINAPQTRSAALVELKLPEVAVRYIQVARADSAGGGAAACGHGVGVGGMGGVICGGG